MKTFKQACEDVGIIFLKIPKHEKESDIIKVIHKFEFQKTKYKICKVDNEFIFYTTKYNSRYYHPVKNFETLKAAENFIFTSEEP